MHRSLSFLRAHLDLGFLRPHGVLLWLNMEPLALV